VIAELIHQYWPLLLALITGISGAAYGHFRATRQADARVAVAQTGQAVAEERARRAEKDAKEVVEATDRMVFNRQKRDQTNEQVANTPLDDVRSELQRDWSRKD
jgi:hypothetical protein